MTMSGGVRENARGAFAARAVVVWENIRSGLAALVRAPRPLPAPFAPAWRRLAGYGVLAAGSVALAMTFLDAPVYAYVGQLPSWLIDIADEITDFGRSAWILVPLSAPILLIALIASPALDHMSRAVLAMTVTRLGFVFNAVALPGLASTVIKRWIGRVRPSASGPFAYEPFSWRPDYASLPSGHTTTAFAALVAIGLLVPRARPYLWVYAVLIALSRVAVSAHFASDVIAGAAFGALGALLVRDWFAARRLGFHVLPDGRVRAMPGPSLRRIKRVAATLLAP